jgi:hypothetical protein
VSFIKFPLSLERCLVARKSRAPLPRGMQRMLHATCAEFFLRTRDSELLSWAWSWACLLRSLINPLFLRLLLLFLLLRALACLVHATASWLIPFKIIDSAPLRGARCFSTHAHIDLTLLGLHIFSGCFNRASGFYTAATLHRATYTSSSILHVH